MKTMRVIVATLLSAIAFGCTTTNKTETATTTAPEKSPAKTSTTKDSGIGKGIGGVPKTDEE